jgi:hypothetical protein
MSHSDLAIPEQQKMDDKVSAIKELLWLNDQTEWKKSHFPKIRKIAKILDVPYESIVFDVFDIHPDWERECTMKKERPDAKSN